MEPLRRVHFAAVAHGRQRDGRTARVPLGRRGHLPPEDTVAEHRFVMIGHGLSGAASNIGLPRYLHGQALAPGLARGELSAAKADILEPALETRVAGR